MSVSSDSNMNIAETNGPITIQFYLSYRFRKASLGFQADIIGEIDVRLSNDFCFLIKCLRKTGSFWCSAQKYPVKVPSSEDDNRTIVHTFSGTVELFFKL